LKSGTLLAWDWFDLPIKDMTGLMAADGRSLSRAEYPKLFAELGVFWGFEDEEHFNLPNLSEYLVVVDEHSLG
jgi:microcystin-dependent protein